MKMSLKFLIFFSIFGFDSFGVKVSQILPTAKEKIVVNKVSRDERKSPEKKTEWEKVLVTPFQVGH